MVIRPSLVCAAQSAVLGFGVFRVLERYGITSGLSVAENVILQTTSVATATMPLAAGQLNPTCLERTLARTGVLAALGGDGLPLVLKKGERAGMYDRQHGVRHAREKAGRQLTVLHAHMHMHHISWWLCLLPWSNI